jgi:hypothetical protein
MTRFGNEGSPRSVPKGVIELVKAAPATAGLSSDHFMGLHSFIGQAS